MNILGKSPRDQLKMMSLEDYVEKGSIVRVIDSFVDATDLLELGFTNNSNKKGRPSYPTDVMVKLFLYGYMNGIRSTRKLEKACRINLELKWLLCDLTPKYRTIGSFRINNLDAFNKLFFKTIEIALHYELIGGKTLAFDSFPIRASNSRKNTYNKKKLGFLREHAQSQLDKYIKELDDDQENEDDANQKIDHYENKLKEYNELDKQLDDHGSTQLCMTDADARVISKNDRSNMVGYRVQCGADAKHKIICSSSISNQNDHHSTATIAKQAKNNIGANKFDALYDKGYHSGPQMAQLSQINITPYVSPPKYKDYGVYPHSDFKYNKRYDSYTCPAGQRLSTNGRWRMRGKRKVKNYQNTKACRNCTIKHECTNRKAGRLIARYEYFEHVELNKKRIRKKPEYYKLRSQTIEHIFGTIKRHWGIDHTLLRTKRKVRVEFDIAFASYNLKRISAILGFNNPFIGIYELGRLVQAHASKMANKFIYKIEFLDILNWNKKIAV